MAKASKAEEIYEYLKVQILSGRWKPGDRLNDLELSEEIQVSRTSVREALFKLTESGIIEKQYWKGYFINTIDSEKVSNIIQLRIILECQGIMNFIDEKTDQKIIDLKNAIENSEKLLNQDDFANYLKIDFTFHEKIYTNQKNNFIASTMKSCMLLIHFIRFLSMGEDKEFIATGRTSIEQHRGILEAIKLGDKKLAAKRLTEHLNQHKSKTLAELTIHKNFLK